MKRWRLLPLVLLLLLSGLGSLLAAEGGAWLEPSRALTPPSRVHWLGCGEGGVDLWLAVQRGVWGSLWLALSTSSFGLLLGTGLGGAAGYWGGRFERGLSRVLDTVQALPSFFVALALLSSVREPNRWHLALVFSATAWAPFARLSLAESRVLRSVGYVEASRALGRTEWATLRLHVLPQLLPIAVVQLGGSAAAVVLGETGLSFLGFVAQSGPPSLGSLLEQGVFTMLVAPHVLIVAALSVIVTNASLLLATGGESHSG